jgi:hypothetical protein
MNLKSASILICLYVLSYVPSATAWEDCYAYERKGDRTGYSACNSRNTAETERRREWERQEQERKDRALKESSERYETDKFREKQLELQRQQLEQLKENKQLESQRLESQRRQLESNRNRESLRASSCSEELKAYVEMFSVVEEMVGKSLKNQLASNNCSAAKETFGIVVTSTMVALAASSKAKGISSESTDELLQMAFQKTLTSFPEYANKCDKSLRKFIDSSSNRPIVPPSTGEIVGNQPANYTSRLRVEFDERSWIEIRDAKEKFLLVGEYPAGTRKSVEGQAPFKIWIGTAPSVRLYKGDRKIDLKPHTREEVARLTLE